MFAEQIDNIRANVGKPSPDETPIIYGALTDPENYSQSRPPPSRASLMEEAIALVIAGTDTTGATMTLGTYHLCKHPEKYARLKTELKEVWPDLKGPTPTAQQLEKLPYLVSGLLPFPNEANIKADSGHQGSTPDGANNYIRKFQTRTSSRSKDWRSRSPRKCES